MLSWPPLTLPPPWKQPIVLSSGSPFKVEANIRHGVEGETQMAAFAYCFFFYLFMIGVGFHVFQVCFFTTNLDDWCLPSVRVAVVSVIMWEATAGCTGAFMTACKCWVSLWQCHIDTHHTLFFLLPTHTAAPPCYVISHTQSFNWTNTWLWNILK